MALPALPIEQSAARAYICSSCTTQGEEGTPNWGRGGGMEEMRDCKEERRDRGEEEIRE